MTNNRFIVLSKDQWQKQNPVLLKVKKDFQIIFDIGGYLAGGFILSLLSTKPYNDIDVFFRTKKAFETLIENVGDHFIKEILITSSKNEGNYEKGGYEKLPTFNRKFDKPLGNNSTEPIPWTLAPISEITDKKIQYIPFNFHEPKELLDKFDFINSMVAFDGEYLYKHESFDILLQNDRCLMINPYDIRKDENLPRRIGKYHHKKNYSILLNSERFMEIALKHHNNDVFISQFVHTRVRWDELLTVDELLFMRGLNEKYENTIDIAMHCLKAIALKAVNNSDIKQTPF